MTPNAIPDRRQDGGAAAPPPPATVTPAPETNAPKPVPPPPVKIPAGTPKEQIRRVAFLHGAEQTANCYRFAAFFEDVALKVSKKPLYVERALLLEIAPDQTSTTVLGQVMKSGAVAIFGFLEGMRPVQRKDLQELFEKSNLFFRTIAPEDAEKRAAAIDLVVDIMLL
ncbi:MAG TPA: hypothetical protein VNI01_02250 [Elusimicrobiota bacterium]|nr:hypothetical protein [Elusimicrobiota bacterium]